MAEDLTLQLKVFQQFSRTEREKALVFSKRSSPLVRVQHEIQQQLRRDEKYRMSILKKLVAARVADFAGINDDCLLSLAHFMEEREFVKGDVIVKADEPGISFHILIEGSVILTKTNSDFDEYDYATEVVLEKDSYFGEMGLLSNEPLRINVHVDSNKAKCLVLTKEQFDEAKSTLKRREVLCRDIISWAVLNMVPLFKSLTLVTKKKLHDAMSNQNIPPGNYICREGTTGNNFYILTDGTCKITKNRTVGDIETEEEIAMLRPGNFFGELALINKNNIRTANVIAMTNVSAMVLNRADFDYLLSGIKEFMDQISSNNQQYVATDVNKKYLKGHDGKEDMATTALRVRNSLRRRVSGYNNSGHLDALRLQTLMRRFNKFASEALWCSLYSRLYIEIRVLQSKVMEYGKHAAKILRENLTRQKGVDMIRDKFERIMTTDSSQRSRSDIKFIIGIMSQRNSFKDLCQDWSVEQYTELCKRVRFHRVDPLHKIIEVDTRGTSAFLIVRGAVRLFSKVKTVDADKNLPLQFDEDLVSGEMFAEDALQGLHIRFIRAQAITPCDLISIDFEDYMACKDNSKLKISVEDKFQFLSKVALLKKWQPSQIYKLAHSLTQEEVERGRVMLTKGATSFSLYFVLSGRVDIVTNPKGGHCISSLDRYSYFGESGLVGRLALGTADKLAEDFYAVTSGKVDVLVLPEYRFSEIDAATAKQMLSSFNLKSQWRQGRVDEMLATKRQVVGDLVRRRREEKELELEEAAAMDAAGFFSSNSSVATREGVEKMDRGRVGSTDLTSMSTVSSMPCSSFSASRMVSSQSLPSLTTSVLSPPLATSRSVYDLKRAKAAAMAESLQLNSPDRLELGFSHSASEELMPVVDLYEKHLRLNSVILSPRSIQNSRSKRLSSSPTSSPSRKLILAPVTSLISSKQQQQQQHVQELQVESKGGRKGAVMATISSENGPAFDDVNKPAVFVTSSSSVYLSFFNTDLSDNDNRHALRGCLRIPSALTLPPPTPGTSATARKPHGSRSFSRKF